MISAKVVDSPLRVDTLIDKRKMAARARSLLINDRARIRICASEKNKARSGYPAALYIIVSANPDEDDRFSLA
jgi:hypothetical protein